jgi:NitT/TauT family transport system ATP-binding protein
MVFQTFALFPWLTVEQNIALPLLSSDLSARERKDAVGTVIDLIGLPQELTHASFLAGRGSA